MGLCVYLEDIHWLDVDNPLGCTRSPGGHPHLGNCCGLPFEKGVHNSRHCAHVGKCKNGELRAFPTWSAGEVPHMVISAGN